MIKQSKDQVVRQIAAVARPIAPWLVLGGLLDILGVLCAAAAPALLGDLIQLLYDSWQQRQLHGIRESLVGGLGFLLLAYGGGSLMNYWNIVIMNKAVSRHFCCSLRINISEKLKKLPVRYVDQTSVGDILSRMTGDVSEMSGYIHMIFNTFIKSGTQILVITVAMFLENWVLAIFVVLLTPLSMMLSAKMAGTSEKYYDARYKKSGELTQIVEETFSNFPTGKAYNLQGQLQEKYEAVNKALEESAWKANFAGGIVQPLIRFTNSLAYILINLIGGYLVIRGSLPVGVLVTIVLYARQFADPLEQVAFGLSQMNPVKAAAKRVFEILNMEEEPQDEGSSMALPEGRVEFDHVDFSYDPKEPLIEDLSIVVQPGQKAAIVGPTGAGKTTIVNLLMRFYDPQQGAIRLDGRDLAQLSRDAARCCFGMVLQDTWLFHGTILENVAYGCPSASREAVIEACRQTYCDAFIRRMPDGYDTVIGEDTQNISGGQKQLLTIARALLADKPVLILDEATSNVDTRTEVLIQKAMDRLMAGRTCFVIAHRLSTIVDADLILVLNHGKIVEQGTHTALLEQKGFYHTLYTSQYAI